MLHVDGELVAVVAERGDGPATHRREVLEKSTSASENMFDKSHIGLVLVKCVETRRKSPSSRPRDLRAYRVL